MDISVWERFSATLEIDDELITQKRPQSELAIQILGQTSLSNLGDEPLRTKSMKMSMHIGRRRHDAQHSDNDYDSDPEEHFGQRATYKPLHSPRASVRCTFAKSRGSRYSLLMPARQTIAANSVILESNNRP